MATAKSKSIIRGDRTVKDANFIEKNALLIENTLEAFGVFVKVTEIKILDKYYEYFLEVAVGTRFSTLEKLDRELATALSSPTGKVDWLIPVPGKFLVGLRVPKPPKEYFEEIENEKQRRWKENTLRNKIAFGFYLLGQLNQYIAYKILGKNELTNN